ncbi:putative ABC1 transport [Fusarium denticulatum]|uniref:Putative ABC1 transport n=1 Tax=Fusarium denticulatum TaxID=48507 RepID=A0A8H5T5J4_9HYPO|nr:putative ABC1 transport [Fusarium denticulatum]
MMPHKPLQSKLSDAQPKEPASTGTPSKHGPRDLEEVHVRKRSDDESTIPDQKIKVLARRVSDTHVEHSSLLTLASTPLPQPGHDNVNSPLSPRLNSNLDPRSANFDASTWTKEFIKLTESDPNSGPRRALGVAFKNLSVFGSSTSAQFQTSVGNFLASIARDLARVVSNSKHYQQRLSILRDFEGVVEKGEMLLVLGPPGSGCSTFLKTLSSQTMDLEVSDDAYMNYRGIDASKIRSAFRGDVLYNAELDNHLAHLTVGETLTFASRARTPHHIPTGFSRKQFDRVNRDVMMAIFGLTHTVDTRVGDDVIRGISGGERKRVSIAEAALTGAKFQCWDNSTRGLDSASAINFCQNLRLQADLLGTASAVSLYQAPQSAYDLFDRVIVIYEGRQIFFGDRSEAKQYFQDLGFQCPERQTVPGFLTSMTSPHERRVRQGFEDAVPRTPDEFVNKWKTSHQRQRLVQELSEYKHGHPPMERLEEYQKSRRSEQAKSQRTNSPYTISYGQQVSLTSWRAWRRLLADPGFTIASLLFNLIMALILGSMFYNLQPDSSSFYYRGGIIFFSLMFNAFSSQLEVLTIYAERPVVEKQNRYAFYHQSAQAVASYLCDLPYKIANMFVFNILVYFMANLRREPGPFFFFCLVTLLATLSQSAIFRTLASITRTPEQAMIPTALLSMGLMIYTGFTMPTAYMPDWSRWMGYVNPLAYSFEALMVNEFQGREFACAGMIPQGPGYDNLSPESRICSVVGSDTGSSVVNGDKYINLSFSYYSSHKWRNIAVLCGFTLFFFFAYLAMAEFSKPPKTRGEILIFRRGQLPSTVKADASNRVMDLETQAQANRHSEIERSYPSMGEKSSNNSNLGVSKSVFHWEDLCYDIKVKSGAERRLLDHIDGWVSPGKTTALMGVSGAGKTTLLDVLATRVSVGVVSGHTLINGVPTDVTFQHQVGYVQQQDIHLREGLNVEQRKRLTIGVELAARPQLLVFFDEPTSGLDSQTSWAISVLIRKLANSGQAILCTIHQPSAMLFDQFDRLLLIAPGGKTVFFGDLGSNSSSLIEYFERNGAPAIPADANPAEWILEIIKPPQDGSKGIDWHQVWLDSSEYQDTKTELSRLRSLASTTSTTIADDKFQQQEFVTSFYTQFWEVIVRTSKHFWRSPGYIWSKIALITLPSLYLGFSYSANNSIQGLQNQLWAIFMCLVLFININEQIMPMFVPQRNLYESRERPSKIYRWTTYIMANILIELFWNSIMAVIMYFCWYYPVGFVRNTTPDDQAIRGFLVFLFLWTYLLFTSTFAHLAIVWIDLPETAGVLTSLFWMLCILFCGIGVPRADLPGFWTFMYRASPATYLVGGIMSTAVANNEVTCAEYEVLHVVPPSGGNMSCEDFLGPFAEVSGGRVLNPAARDLCGYCPLATTNDFLAQFELSYDTRWRDFGLVWVFILFNIGAALGLYWAFRTPRGKSRKVKRA